MESKFVNITTEGKDVFHLQFPKTVADKSVGMNAYSYIPKSFGLVFRCPTLLHTFGSKHRLKLMPLNSGLRQMGDCLEFPVNSIAVCRKFIPWVAELTCEPTEPMSLFRPSSFAHFHQTQKNIYVFRLGFNALIIFRLLMFFIALLSASFLCAASEPREGAIKLQVGESKEVALPEAPRSLDISQPDVIDVQRIGASERILVTALKSGLSRLVARFPSGQLKHWQFQIGNTNKLPFETATLSSASLLRSARELQRRTGLDVVVDNGRIGIFGLIHTEAQLKALFEICLGQDECLPRFSVSDAMAQELVRKINAHLSALGFSQVKVKYSLGGFIADGYLADDSQLQGVLQAIKSVAPRTASQIQVDRSSQPLIESTLSFFRVSQSGLTALGLSAQSPDSPMSSAEAAHVSLSKQTAKLHGGPLLTLALPDLVLKALSQKGVVQHIAQPSVVIASGGRGEILSGGELLFQSGGQVQKFYTQNYGLSVVLQPRLLTDSHISLRVELRITHPQADPTQKATSSHTASVLNTEVNLRADEPLLLTRISQKADGKSVSKIPILGHLPLVGELFKSRELTTEDAELWITIKSRLALSEAPVLSIQDRQTPANPKAHWLD